MGYCGDSVILCMLFIERDGGMSCQCRGYYGSEGLLYSSGFLAVVKKLVTAGSDLYFLSCLFMSCYNIV